MAKAKKKAARRKVAKAVKTVKSKARKAVKAGKSKARKAVKAIKSKVKATRKKVAKAAARRPAAKPKVKTAASASPARPVKSGIASRPPARDRNAGIRISAVVVERVTQAPRPESAPLKMPFAVPLEDPIAPLELRPAPLFERELLPHDDEE